MKDILCALIVLSLAACCPDDPPGCADAAADAATSDSVAPDAGAWDGAPADYSAAEAGTCAKPLAFAPPKKPAGWKHTTTKLLVVTQGPANHRAQDVVAVAGAPQVLIGKFAYGPLDKDLKGEDVDVYMQKSPPCGPWVLLGTAVTSQDGQHGQKYGINDDGGRVFFTVPAAHARPVGRYPVRMLVRGDNSVAALTLYVVSSKTDAVVFDIDGTLTTDDFQLVTQLFIKLQNGTYVPKAYAGATDITTTWAAKGYLVLYLTGRPDSLRTITQKWLVQQKMPPGPLHLTDTLAQALPTSSGVAKYKSDFLKKTVKEAKVALGAAYGNATTDIEAYEAASVPKARTFIIGKNRGKKGTVAVTSYPVHLPAAKALPAATVKAPPATFGW